MWYLATVKPIHIIHSCLYLVHNNVPRSVTSVVLVCHEFQLQLFISVTVYCFSPSVLVIDLVD